MAKIIPANIAEGVTILGVAGTHQSGATERIDPVAAGMNGLARVLVKRQAGSNINEHVLDEEWDI